MTRPCICPPDAHPEKPVVPTYPGFAWSSLLDEISRDRSFTTTEDEEVNE